MTKEIETNVENSASESTAETGAAVNVNSIVKPLLDKDLLKNLRSALGGDRVAFESTEESTAYAQVEKLIGEAAGKTTNESGPFYGLPILIRRGSEKVDPIESAARIVVASIGQRDKATSTNGIKAIAIFEQPTAGAFLESTTDEAKNFVVKLIEREASDVAFGGLRGADMTLSDLQTAVESIPATVDGIVTTQRASSGIDTDAFDSVWTSFRIGVLRAKQPTLESALPQKPEIIKSLRSKAFALAHPRCAEIESAGLWVKIGNALIKAGSAMLDKDGKPAPVDMSTVAGWLENRDELVITYEVPTITSEQLAEIDF